MNYNTYETSSVKTGDEVNAINRMFVNQNTQSFDRLLHSAGDDFLAGIYKYPMNLMNDPAHQCIMRIQIYENDPKYLYTKREEITRLIEATAELAQDYIKNGQINSLVDRGTNAIQGAADKVGLGNVPEYLRANAPSVETQQDAIAKVELGVKKLLPATIAVTLGTAKQALADGDLKGQGRGRDSYTEEQTGVAGGTKKTPLHQTVYLYTPTGIETTYGMEYEDADMANLDNLKLVKAMYEKNAEASKDIGKRMALANLKLLDQFGEFFGVQSGQLGKFISAQHRQVVNPMTLHLFKGVKRREFNFSYTFIPRNSVEVEQIYSIIHLLKHHAHPKRSEGSGRFLDYPAEFQIDFLAQDGRENPHLPKILKCALRDIKIKYGDEAVMSTFYDQAGPIPTKIVMDLSFSELEILTSDRMPWTGGGAIYQA